MADGVLAVRRRASARAVARIGGVAVLALVSVAFLVGAAAGPPSFGAFFFLLLGVVGVAVFGGGAVAMTGQLLAGRPVLVLDDGGVRLPAPWPRPRTRDRVLPWPELASIVLWSREVPGRRRPRPAGLAFLPTPESARESRPPPSAELVALRLSGVPGVATLRWSVPVTRWDVAAEEVAAAARRHSDVPFVDARPRR